MEKRGGSRGLLMYAGFVLAAIFLVVVFWQMIRANDLSRTVKSQYAEAFTGFSVSFNEIDTLLKKAEVSQSREVQSELFLNLYMQARVAEVHLSFLPIENETLLKAKDFVSRVRAFASGLCEEMVFQKAIDEQTEQLFQFNETLNALRETFFNTEATSLSPAEETVLKAKTTDAAQPLLLEDKPLFTRDEARQVAEVFLENERGRALAPNGESDGEISTYDFVAQPANNRTATVSVTRHGGYVLSMHDDRQVTTQNLDTQTAVLAAKRFLARQGLYHMRPCYYEVHENVATVTAAALQQETVLQNDIIKVEIALDNGEVVGYDAKAYIMHHHMRQIPESFLSVKEAQTFLNPRFSVSSAVLSFIPSADGEVFCYAFCGRYNNQQFLIYINAETGAEEKIQLLPEIENGSLLF